MASNSSLRMLRLTMRAPLPAGQFSVRSAIPSTSRLYATAPPPANPPPLSSIAQSLRASAQAGSSSRHTERKPYKDSYVEQLRSTPSASAKSHAPLRELTEAEQYDESWRALPIADNNTISLTLTTSRSIEVKGNDIATAYRRLSKILNENNIRRELKRQDRFESGSDMRVRLNSERHRRRYKVAVGKAVSLAMRMKE